jgi:hypothetical protein
VSSILAALVFFVPIGGLLFTLHYLSRSQRRARTLGRLPVTRIADAKDGELVRIAGVLRVVGEPLIAPLSGRSCAYFVATVQEVGFEGGSTREGWVDRFVERDVRNFVVEDTTGRARVETERFEAFCMRDVQRGTGPFRDATPELAKMLARHEMKSTGDLGMNRQLRFEEGSLEDGERVTVIGRARWKRGKKSREPHLVIEAGDEPVRATDDPALTTD